MPRKQTRKAAETKPVACRICGVVLLALKNRGRPREYHISCKHMNDAMIRLEATIQTVRWSDDPHYALLTRRRLYNILNGLPIERHAVRDERGRFV